MQATTPAMSSCVQHPYHVQKTSFHNTLLHPPALTSFLPILLQCSLSLGQRGLYGYPTYNWIFLLALPCWCSKHFRFGIFRLRASVWINLFRIFSSLLAIPFLSSFLNSPKATNLFTSSKVPYKQLRRMNSRKLGSRSKVTFLFETSVQLLICLLTINKFPSC